MDIDDDLIPDAVPDGAPDAFEDNGGHMPDAADAGSVDAGDEAPPEPEDPQHEIGQTVDEPIDTDAAADLGTAGEADIFASQDQAANIWDDVADEPLPDLSGELFDLLGATYSDFDFAGYDDLAAAYGTPEYEMQFWDPQDEPNSCLIAVTSETLNSMGISMDEPLLADFLEQEGIYDPMRGTNPQEMAEVMQKLADAAGTDLQVVSYSGSSTADLEEMLKQGLHIQVSLDAADLYSDGQNRLLDELGLSLVSPHAVHLIGIEHTPEGVNAIINDPQMGPGLKFPIEIFNDARADMGDSGIAFGNAETMASLRDDLGESESDVRLGSATESLRVDNLGFLHRGNSPHLIPKPGGGWMKLGE